MFVEGIGFAGLAGLFGWLGCGAGVEEGGTEKFHFPRSIDFHSIPLLGKLTLKRASIDVG